MKKIFTFLFAIVASMNFFAECVPSIPAPQNGYVTFVIRIPIGTECNGIAFKGTLDYNNWTGSDQYLGENGVGARDNCIKFEPIEGYQGWFKATYKLGNEFVSSGVTARMMGRICLIYTGDYYWEGQAAGYDFLEDYCTASHSISSDGNIRIHSSGLIYIHIASWQKSECDMVINATYEEIGFTGFVNCDIFSCNYIFDAQKGSVDGPTEARIDSSSITCTAIPNRGYQFISWSDGNTDNPRTIELTQDTTMEAIFDYQLSEKCGKDSVLTWKLDTTAMALTITGKGALSENYTYGTFIQSLTIGNEITSIGQSAFYGCNNLKNVLLGSSVKVLEQSAFYNCSNIETITCYSQRPPTVNQNALYGLDYSTIVYVPADYLNYYFMHDAWGLYDVRPLGAKSVETTDVAVVPSETTAEVAWPAVTGAATYELVIKDKEGNIICTLIFNSNGQLTQIAFNAPARSNAPQQTQNAGFSFTVTGLEGGSEYDLTIIAKDNNGVPLDSNTISFTTTGGTPTGIGNATEEGIQTTKLLRNGQILILRGDKTYTLTGQEIK